MSEKSLDNNWLRVQEALSKNTNYGKKWSKLFREFADISYQEAKESKYSHYKHAAHAFIWAKNDNLLWSNYFQRAAILMQMRFDGYIGFPGGIIDDTDESWEAGLNRELSEEMNLDSKYELNAGDYFFSSISHELKLILHFYTKEVQLEEFYQIEKRCMDSVDFGSEVTGLIRPVLYELPSDRGFHIFIQNQFIGNSLLQLIRTICRNKILNVEDVIYFINKC
jgi:U8 snoRNA-decapping enzyme